MRAAFVPRISDELDVSNFADEFTGMPPTDSPAIVPANVDKIFKVAIEIDIPYSNSFFNQCRILIGLLLYRPFDSIYG